MVRTECAAGIVLNQRVGYASNESRRLYLTNAMGLFSSFPVRRSAGMKLVLDTRCTFCSRQSRHWSHSFHFVKLEYPRSVASIASLDVEVARPSSPISDAIAGALLKYPLVGILGQHSRFIRNFVRFCHGFSVNYEISVMLQIERKSLLLNE